MHNKNRMRIIFMGTPDFAVSSLKKLHGSGFEIAAVVTAPDRLGGRGRKLRIESEVKKAALALGLPVLQPEKLRNSSFVNQLIEFNAQIFIVVAFRMLPKIIWSIPPLGTINLHASLLPKYRGAAPINWAIINGEKETGLTTFLIEGEIDTGRILLQHKISIEKEDNFGSLYSKLKVMGADLLVKTLDQFAKGAILPVIQEDSHASYAPKIFMPSCEIKASMDSLSIFNLVRGLAPIPGAWLKTQEGIFKIFATGFGNSPESEFYSHISPGTFFTYSKRLFLRTVDGTLEILEIQPEGKKLMSAQDFINGSPFLKRV